MVEFVAFGTGVCCECGNDGLSPFFLGLACGGIEGHARDGGLEERHALIGWGGEDRGCFYGAMAGGW